MISMSQTASRIAMIALLGGTPMALSAQTTTEEPATEAPADSTEAPADSTEAPADSTEAPADTTESPADSTEAPADTTVTETPADDTATDTETVEVPESETPEETMEPVEVDPLAAGTETEVAEEPAKPIEGQIRMQSENTILADNLIGSNVFSDVGDDIGEIDNLIVNLDGMVEGVVIGVGGFLGIGKKMVAIEMGSLSTATDENGNIRLVTSATQADLEAAEPFVTMEDQAAAERSMETMPEGDAAPADGTAPAPTGN